MQREQQESLAQLYSNSRIFEEFRDNVCLAIQDGSLPPISGISVRTNGVCFVTEPDGNISAYSSDAPDWVLDLKETMSASMDSVAQKLERDREQLDFYPTLDGGTASLCVTAENTIKWAEAGNGVGTEQYEQELLKLLDKGYGKAGVAEFDQVDFSSFQTKALERYRQIAAEVEADAEIAGQRTDALIQILREDLQELQEKDAVYSKLYSEKMENKKLWRDPQHNRDMTEAGESLDKIEAQVIRDIHHLKDNFTVVSGEVDNGNPEISEQPAILQIRAAEIAQEISAEFAEHVEEMRDGYQNPLDLSQIDKAEEKEGPDPLSLAESEDKEIEQISIFDEKDAVDDLSMSD